MTAACNSCMGFPSSLGVERTGQLNSTTALSKKSYTLVLLFYACLMCVLLNMHDGKQALTTSEEAASTAAQRVLELLQQAREQWSEQQVVHACKLTRALCLAGRCVYLQLPVPCAQLPAVSFPRQLSPVHASARC